jgi:hypothetical protein
MLPDRQSSTSARIASMTASGSNITSSKSTGGIAPRGEETVAVAVPDLLLPAFVVQSAVCLEHDAGLDKNVDAADPLEGNLNVAGESGIQNELAEHGLLARVDARIDPGAERTVDVRDVREDLPEIPGLDVALVECGVQRGKSEVTRLALDDLG